MLTFLFAVPLASSSVSRFGGMFIKPRSIPEGWKWFHYVDPVPKAFTGVAMGQFYCDVAAGGCPTFQPTAGAAPVAVYDYVRVQFNSSVHDYGHQVAYLILEICVIRILVLIALKKVSHIQR